MKKSIVELAKERWEQASSSVSLSRSYSNDDINFVMGDSDNLYQWPYEYRADQYKNKVKLTVNGTAQQCNAVTNSIRQNRPQSKVIPVDDYADKRTAEIMAGWLRSVQSYSNADDAHDNAMEYSVWGGEGYWRVILDFEDENSFNEIPYIAPIEDFNSVYIDNFAKKPDRSDADWGFICVEMSKEQVEREFPGVEPSSWETNDPWIKKDAVIVAEYYYCDYKKDVLEKYVDGTSGFRSDNKGQEVINEDGSVDFMPAKEVALNDKGKPITRKAFRKQWYWCKLVGGENEPVEKREWPGSYLPIIGTYGKTYRLGNQTITKGMVRDLKDPARMVNYTYSAAVETVALQTKVPFIASKEAIQGYESYWSSANTINHSYLPYNQFDKEGRPVDQPRRAEPAVIPSAQIQLLQLSIEQMKEASGQHNAVFGKQSNETSGIAIQRRKQQGEIATFHYPDNLSRALRYEATILIDLMPKVCTEAQIIRMLGIDGKEEKAKLIPDMQQPYMDSNVDEIKGIFNPNVGKYDVAIVTGPSYQTQREESAAVIQGLIQADPSIMQTHKDLVFGSIDIPNAEAWIERARKTLPPQLQEESNEEVPPQVQAQLDEMKQALEEAFNHVQQLEKEKQDLEIQSREAKAKATISDIEAKEAKSLLTINKAEQGARQSKEEPEEEEYNPDIDEILYKIEESNIKQERIMEMIANAIGIQPIEPKQTEDV